MKYLKRTFNLFMAVVIVFNIAVNDYIVANATGEEIIVPTLSVLDSVLTTFGISIGIGVQKSHADLNDDMFNLLSGVANKETVSMTGYGDVDFSDDQSIKDFIDWAYLYNDYSIGAISPTDVQYSHAVDLLAQSLDSTSYAVTGSCATNSMNDYVSNLRNKADTAGLSDDIANLASAAIGKIPVDKIEGWWTDVCGFVSCIAMAHADAFSDWANGFETPETTEFNEYNMQDVALGYTGAYPFYSNTRDDYWELFNDYFVVGTGTYYENTVNGRDGYYLMYSDCSMPYMILGSNGCLCFYYIDSSASKGYSCLNVLARYPDYYKYGKYTYSSVNSEYSFFSSSALSLPLFDSHTDAHDFYYNGAISKVLNPSAYVDFKTHVPGVSQTIGKSLTNVKVGELPTVIDAVDDVVVGLPGTIPKTVEVVDTIVADPSIPVPDNPAIDDPVVVDPDKPVEDEDENPKPAPAPTPIPDSSTSPGFIGGILALLSILLMLLKIFLHLLEFIVNIFKIPADPGFITGDFKLGFEYIKTVKLSPLNMSIYDFLMGLVHITIFFGVVKILRQKIDKIHF